jgi:3-oxoacyl-[acyl-carrier protein] reductase
MTASLRRVAIVTGAGRGIGRAIAEKLAENFDLAITDVDPKAEAVGEELQRHGGRALFVQSDLADLATHERALELIVEHFGRIDCLVNNAGIASPARGDLLELTPENYDRVLAVNLRGTLFFTQATARRMLTRRRTARARSSPCRRRMPSPRRSSAATTRSRRPASAC